MRNSNKHHLDWLRAVPKTAVFRDQVFLCHATPDHDEIYWLETVLPDGTVRMSSLDAIEEHAQGIAQSLILCAHTHLARAVRLRDGRLIVNPGSVGSPGYRDTHPFPHVIEAGTPDARYAILELAAGAWRVTFRHVPYDHETMAALARQNGQAELAHALATGWIERVARMERSAIREGRAAKDRVPDYASLHPGYAIIRRKNKTAGYSPAVSQSAN